MKKALISGITGQDGAYLSEFLLEKGYEVHGIIRRSSSFNTGRIDPIVAKYTSNGVKLLKGHYGDLTDSSNLNRILEKVQPDEIYNLGAQSHVQISFEVPEYTAEVDALGVLRFLDALKETKLDAKFYQASTSELFGKVQEIPQTEKTPFYPRSPYAVAKLYAFWVVVNYREAYDLFACNGILFNHESPLRGENFITKKVTQTAAKIKLDLQDKLKVGSLESKRDWGYAPEYVEGMWLMLQQGTPDDFILSTGETHSVRELIECAFKELDMHIEWSGSKENEKGIDQKTGKVLIEVDPVYYRPTEVDLLVGDSSKAKEKLGWEPRIKFHELIKLMVKFDFEEQKNNVKDLK